jgi:acetoin utilization deacetylase AcuC-like enzyme
MPVRSLLSNLRKKVQVVFSHAYYHGVPGLEVHGILDSMKFKKVRDLLVSKNLVSRHKILIPEMISYADMALAHDQEYLNQITNPLNVARFLRLEMVDPWDSDILEYFRIVAGGTLLAACQSWRRRVCVFNLGGGFHHAHRNRAAGYCLINDVAIAIKKVRKVHPTVKKIMIIDLDYHQGDGNLTIFESDANVFTYSMHAAHWIEVDTEHNIDIALPENCSGSQYLSLLKESLPSVLSSFSPDLVIYVAGSDTYEKDALGDLGLTRVDMLERNMYVLNQVKEMDIPLTIVAGGGYGPDSWHIYYDFIEAAILNKYENIQ